MVIKSSSNKKSALPRGQVSFWLGFADKQLTIRRCLMDVPLRTQKEIYLVTTKARFVIEFLMMEKIYSKQKALLCFLKWLKLILNAPTKIN